jgi:Tol biopolymer transport system component
VIFRFVGWLAVRLICVFTAMVIIWVIAVHGFYPSLPRLLYSHDNQKALYSWAADCPSLLATCTRERMLLDGLNIFPVAQWSPDGNFIAVFLPDSWAIYPADCLLGSQTCKPARLERPANDTRIAWGPDGSTLAYIANSSSATLKIMTRGCWDKSLEQRCLRQSIDVLPKGILRQVTWSADGSRFAFQGLVPNGLYVLDSVCLDEPESCADDLQSVAVNLSPVYWPSLSADGSQILYFAYTLDGVEQIYISHVDSESVQQVTFRASGGSVPAWSFDERYIAFAGFQTGSGGDLGIYVLDRQRGLTARAVFRHGQDFTYPAWSPRP